MEAIARAVLKLVLTLISLIAGLVLIGTFAVLGYFSGVAFFHDSSFTAPGLAEQIPWSWLVAAIGGVFGSLLIVLRRTGHRQASHYNPTVGDGGGGSLGWTWDGDGGGDGGGGGGD